MGQDRRAGKGWPAWGPARKEGRASRDDGARLGAHSPAQLAMPPGPSLHTAHTQHTCIYTRTHTYTYASIPYTHAAIGHAPWRTGWRLLIAPCPAPLAPSLPSPKPSLFYHPSPPPLPPPPTPSTPRRQGQCQPSHTRSRPPRAAVHCIHPAATTFVRDPTTRRITPLVPLCPPTLYQPNYHGHIRAEPHPFRLALIKGLRSAPTQSSPAMASNPPWTWSPEHNDYYYVTRDTYGQLHRARPSYH